MTLILSGTDGLSDVDGSAATPAIRGTDANTGIFFPAADTIAFSEGGTEAMRIDSSANVGIGTSSPGYKVDVSASSFITASFSTSYSGAGNIRIADASTTSASAPYIGSVGNNLTFGRIGTAEYARIDSSGNVGIGTSSPTDRLQVTRNSPDVARFTNSQTNGGDWQFKIGGGGFEDRKLMITDKFSGADNVRVTIDSSGNLLVGTTSGSDRFMVKSAGTSSAASAITIQNSAGTELMRIRNDGVFYTGGATFSPYNNTTASAANVVVGASGDLFRSTSSLKYKQDVADATHGLAELMQLRPVTYKGKSEADGNKVFGGLIAEEVHQAGLTEFVQYAEDGSPDAIAYGNMVSLCIKAIQEQQAIIQSLTARIEALEGK